MSQDTKKVKKKIGFLGCLMRIFMFCMFVVLVTTGLFFWKKTWATAWTLDLYTQQSISVLTSAEYYDVENDQEYTQRQKEAKETFANLVEHYTLSPQLDWHDRFQKLHSLHYEILKDKKVTKQELDNLVQEAKKYLSH